MKIYELFGGETMLWQLGCIMKIELCKLINYIESSVLYLPVCTYTAMAIGLYYGTIKFLTLSSACGFYFEMINFVKLLHCHLVTQPIYSVMQRLFYASRSPIALGRSSRV
jgi:hypothetical protein